MVGRTATKEEVHEILKDVDFTGKFRRTDSGWWIAYCEEVPEARTQGETKEEALENLKDAIALILEDYSPEKLRALGTILTLEERQLLAL
jgi:predicted RNase H-like HicB family nuclease